MLSELIGDHLERIEMNTNILLRKVVIFNRSYFLGKSLMKERKKEMFQIDLEINELD